MELILPKTADSAKKMFVSGYGGSNSATLSIVGVVTTEEVAVEIPTVESPDVDTPAHWTALMQEDMAVILRAGNNVIVIPSRLLIRLNKAAGVAGNAYGVRWS